MREQDTIDIKARIREVNEATAITRKQCNDLQAVIKLDPNIGDIDAGLALVRADRPKVIDGIETLEEYERIKQAEGYDKSESTQYYMKNKNAIEAELQIRGEQA